MLFGRGAVTRIKDEAERLGVKRALVLSTPGRGEALAKQVSGLLGERSAGIHAGAVMHTPVEATERALLAVKDKAADAVIAVGGGSTTGLSKAIAPGPTCRRSCCRRPMRIRSDAKYSARRKAA